MMRSSVHRLTKTTPSLSATTSSSSTPSSSPPPTVPNSLLHSLYRSLRKELRYLDDTPLMKTLFPIPASLQKRFQLEGALYKPNGPKYTTLLRNAFDEAPRKGISTAVSECFDMLTRLRYHNKDVRQRASTMMEDGKKLRETIAFTAAPSSVYYTSLIDTSAVDRTISSQVEKMNSNISNIGSNKRQQTAAANASKVEEDPQEKEETKKKVEPTTRDEEKSGLASKSTSESDITTPPEEQNNAKKKGVSSRNRAAPTSSSTSTLLNQSMMTVGSGPTLPFAKLAEQHHHRDEAPSRTLLPGMALVAHPLSSAHHDRRVMLITSVTPQTTTALVLDTLHAYPLSAGNPMFPEVFWGNDVFNGGFLHVDFTMPPTACVTVLHTLPPPVVPAPTSSTSATATAAAWIQRFLPSDRDRPSASASASSSSSAAGMPGLGAAGVEPTAEQFHEMLCTPLIRGKVREDGVSEPTLYCSRIEALPYLSNLAAGMPRSAVRLYWGCMRWPTKQIDAEVANGHWVPVQISPSFFSAYPLKEKSAVLSSHARRRALHAEDRFPTVQEMEESKLNRRRYGGAMPPQLFPPDQPMCHREPLWDEILFALGGEYRDLVGCYNPFAEKRGEPIARAPPVEVVVEEEGSHTQQQPSHPDDDHVVRAAAAAAAAAVARHQEDDDDDDDDLEVELEWDDEDDDDDDGDGDSSKGRRGGKPKA